MTKPICVDTLYEMNMNPRLVILGATRNIAAIDATKYVDPIKKRTKNKSKELEQENMNHRRTQRRSSWSAVAIASEARFGDYSHGTGRSI